VVDANDDDGRSIDDSTVCGDDVVELNIIDWDWDWESD
jgi:hypothetical protein